MTRAILRVMEMSEVGEIRRGDCWEVRVAERRMAVMISRVISEVLYLVDLAMIVFSVWNQGNSQTQRQPRLSSLSPGASPTRIEARTLCGRTPQEPPRKTR
jgi:hypothetical protein